MNDFRLKNPNKELISYGFLLLIFFIASLAFKADTLLISAGLIVKVLVLAWIPKASKKANRGPVFWTILCFIIPSAGLLFLGALGYKKSPAIVAVELKFNEKYKRKMDELDVETGTGKLTVEQYKSQLKDFYDILQQKAAQEIYAEYIHEDSAFLNEQLKRKGYVLDENSEVFVGFEDNCPACGQKITSGMNSCPECGLTLS